MEARKLDRRVRGGTEDVSEVPSSPSKDESKTAAQTTPKHLENSPASSPWALLSPYIPT